MTNRYERRRTSAVQVHARNARTHSKRQVKAIAESIRDLGFNNPLVVDEANVLLAGHGRLAAAMLLGLKEVPVVVVTGLSDAQKRAYRLADNKLAEQAGWDRELLALELPELQGLLEVEGLELSLTGFSPPEVDGILTDHEEHGADPADAVPSTSPDQPLVSRPGDLWLLGKHRLLCGDVRSPEDLARLMGGRQAALAFLDPPYNVRVASVVGRGRTKHQEFAVASGELTKEGFTAFLEETLSACAAVSQDGAVHFVCMDWRHIGELLAAGEAAYGALLNLAVWVKSSAGQGSFYRSQHELVAVFRVGDAPPSTTLSSAAMAARARTSGAMPA